MSQRHSSSGHGKAMHCLATGSLMVLTQPAVGTQAVKSHWRGVRAESTQRDGVVSKSKPGLHLPSKVWAVEALQKPCEIRVPLWFNLAGSSDHFQDSRVTGVSYLNPCGINVTHVLHAASAV